MHAPRRVRRVVRRVHLLRPLRPLCPTRPLCPSRASYVERYQRGESLEAIAKAVQLPPTMLARVVLEELWDLKKGKEVGILLKEPHRLSDGRMRREVQRAIAADVCYGPGVDTVRHLIGLEYEAVLEQRLRDLGAPHLTEGDARQSGSFKTPDALLPVPLLVGGRAVQHMPRARHAHAMHVPLLNRS